MTTQSLIAIREASVADVETLVDLNSAMALETENKSLDIQRLIQGTETVFSSPEKGLYVVAEAGGRIVGTLLITFEWSDWRNATYWWIQSVYVRPEWRRKGVYRKLYGWVEYAARSRPSVCGIRLYVDSDNQPAQRTYSSLGMARSRYQLFEADFVPLD